MKLKISCFNQSTNKHFQDTITLASALFATAEKAAAAVRGMYSLAAPDIEVLQVVRLEEMERGDY